VITVTDLFCGAGGSGLGATAVPGVQLVMATHHADDIVPAIDRVLRLEKGRVRAQENRAGQHCAAGVAAT